MNETVFKFMPSSEISIFYKMEFIESGRGHPQPAFEKYVYARQKELNGGVISYECGGRTRLSS